jgi:hypothetical protein
MSASISVKIDKTKLQRAREIAPQEVGRKLSALAFEGERYVKMSFGTSPSQPGQPPGVDLGILKGSINVENPRPFVRNINVGADYGIHLEYGTSKMAARPFMGPMAMWLEQRIDEIFDGIIEDAL